LVCSMEEGPKPKHEREESTSCGSLVTCGRPEIDQITLTGSA
jgi:hypothetical protein